MKYVVGLTGKKGAGKDTFAEILARLYNFKRIGFADALYKEVREAFGVENAVLSNRETKESPLDCLALKHCADAAFVEVAGTKLAIDGESKQEVLDKPRSPRIIMQLWGTEYRRNKCKESYWRDIVTNAIESSPEGSRWVITDVRFKDEARTVEALDGEVIRILRPDVVLSAEAKATLNHPSEVDMDDYPLEYEVVNKEGGFANLEAVAKDFFGHLATEGELLATSAS